MSMTGGMMNPLEYRDAMRSVIFEGKMPDKKPDSTPKKKGAAPTPVAPPKSAVNELMEMRKLLQQRAEAQVK